ncbi:BTB/POZ and MATH domain-containing protein 1-like [Aegilops tauschii subsp. strangulata]|uniref:Speckle-type POZ protein-like protein n=1 Tax=Aegilops tauschii TaxID=37682 RepID=M8AQM3_AEGTA
MVPAPTIPPDFQQLLLRPAKIPHSSKVTFLVEDTKFRAHRLVLAMRLPVFAAELFGHMRESTAQRVRIEDMRASTFRVMLQFIYTDELPVKPNNGEESGSSHNNFKREFMARGREVMVHKLLVAANRVELMCENILCESIDLATVMTTLLLVRGRQRCCQLKDSCIKYITSSPDMYDAVKATKEYEELKETCSSFIIEESEIHAHWLIIAMQSLLLYETLVVSTTNSVVRIGDMKAVVLKAVLHFVYTDELVPVNETVVAREMLAAACWFRLERMKAMCKNLLAHLVLKDNAMSTLELALLHRCEELKIYCNDFIERAMK